MRRVAGCVAGVVVLLALQAGPARAAVFNVSNTSGLLSAVAASNGNGVADQVNIAPGTYTLSSELLIQGNGLTLEGTGTAADTVIHQGGAGRVLNIVSGNTDIDDLTITGGNVNGNGGGVLNQSGVLTVLRSAIEGNHASGSGNSAGGGGIYNADILDVQQSSVSNNTASASGIGSGGGGIWSNNGASIEASTISGNALTVTGSSSGTGGGGYFTFSGGAGVVRTTFADNSAPAGNALYNVSLTSVNLEDSIFAGNGAQCVGAKTLNGNNMDTGNTCQASIPNTDPKLGPLDDNGGGTKTRALLPGSLAIDAGGLCSTQDQRGVNDVGGNCDLGAFEFDGLSVAQVPNCSPTGQIPLGMVAAPNEGVIAFHYKLDGAQTDLPVSGIEASTTLNIPEGRRTLEYWGGFSNGDELSHHAPTVLVDKTDPSVAITSEQKRTIYVITRKASVDVNAADALSGLVQNPSANGERIGTGSRGKKTFAPPAATDLCGNQQSAAFGYQVLGPALGTRAVLERLKGKVLIKRPGKASAAQKGGGFVALRQPREIPIHSFLDTRKGTLRLTSSKSKRATAIQDGQFSGGIFQVRQSKRKKAKGLTELRLQGGKSFRSCATGRGASSSLSKRALRRLRANAKGRFRTRGRFSAATVRGTKFTVTDRCDGTLTKVTRGRVAVTDFRRHKTVIVKAGASYLAKAPG